jgi:hypothetical protein
MLRVQEYSICLSPAVSEPDRWKNETPIGNQDPAGYCLFSTIYPLIAVIVELSISTEKSRSTTKTGNAPLRVFR